MAQPTDLPRIDGHELVKELGRGGMGAVYLARDEALKRQVAVKVLLEADFATPETLARFRHESEAVARLRHPGIVQVYASGHTDGVPWFSMEYVEGTPLTPTLGRGAEGIRRAAALVEVVARALDHAHRQGLIHRDVKPANILVDASGRPYVTDFGVARWNRPEDALGSKRMTLDGSLVGTVAYMAPEQALGDLDAIGPATDVWSLGVVLYELLAGTPPFTAPTQLEAIRKILTEKPPSPAWIRPEIPSALETIVTRCLEREPGARYASAAALADDLGAFLEGKPLPSAGTSPKGGGLLGRLFGRE